MVLENLLHTVTELRFTCSSLKRQVKGKTALLRRMAILGRRQTHEPKNNPRVCSNLCPLSQWCYLIISSSAIPFFFCLQSFPVSVFSNESALHIRWPKYRSFSISPSNEYSGLISFRINWFDVLAVQGTLKSILQHHSLKASVLQCSVFFMVHYKDWIYSCCIKLTKLDIFYQLDFIRSHLYFSKYDLY